MNDLKTYRRRPNHFPLRNQILIVGCGKTETIYFESFNIDLGDITIETLLDVHPPKMIVEHALRLREDNDYRQVWCVFDKDDFYDFDDALRLARQTGIQVGWSNQALELWFLLHFRYVAAPMHRRLHKAALTRCLRMPYRKADSRIYGLLEPYMHDAIRRARSGYFSHVRQGGLPSQWESSTTVYQLVEELLRWRRRPLPAPGLTPQQRRSPNNQPSSYVRHRQSS